MGFREPWMDLALCGRLAQQLSWVKDPDEVTRRELADMRATCDTCTVKASCRDFAEREDITSGFWAGEFRDPPAESVDGAA